MVCEHVYMNISPPPIIELATALPTVLIKNVFSLPHFVRAALPGFHQILAIPVDLVVLVIPRHTQKYTVSEFLLNARHLCTHMSIRTGAPRSPGAPVCPADPYERKSNPINHRAENIIRAYGLTLILSQYISVLP